MMEQRQRALQRQLQVEQVQMQRAVRQNVRFGSEYHQNDEVKCCLFLFAKKFFTQISMRKTNLWMYR